MKVITRYNVPTKYDAFEKGVICRSLKDEDLPEWDTHNCEPPDTDRFDLYIQTSSNKNNPKWEPISDFFQTVFGEVLFDEAVIDEFIRLYEDEDYNSFLALSKVLKKKTRKDTA